MKVVKENPDATHWNIERGYDSNVNESKLYPFRVFATSTNGWFDTYKFKISTPYYASYEFCNSDAKEFKIAIHSNDELPQRFRDFFVIPSQEDITIKITPNVITTSDGLRIYSPQLRGCFYKEERKLRFFKTYSKCLSQINC